MRYMILNLWVLLGLWESLNKFDLFGLLAEAYGKRCFNVRGGGGGVSPCKASMLYIVYVHQEDVSLWLVGRKQAAPWATLFF